MDQAMRKRYEVVQILDLVEFFAEKKATLQCSQCQSTLFSVETVDTHPDTSVAKEDAPELRKQMEVYEMQGADKTWAIYPLSCANCGSFINVDAAKLLAWTEKRLEKAGDAISAGNATESRE